MNIKLFKDDEYFCCIVKISTEPITSMADPIVPTQRDVYQPPYASLSFPIPSENLDFTFCRDVVLLNAIRVDATTVTNRVECYTKNYTKWSVDPSTDTQYFNGCCLYRQDGSTLVLVAQTQNSDSFLCTNALADFTESDAESNASLSGDPSTNMTLQTFPFMSEITLVPGLYYLAVSSKQSSHLNFSMLDMVAYDVNVRENLVALNDTYQTVLVYRYTNGIFASIPPSTISMDTDLEVVVDNGDGYACLLYWTIS